MMFEDKHPKAFRTFAYYRRESRNLTSLLALIVCVERIPQRCLLSRLFIVRIND